MKYIIFDLEWNQSPRGKDGENKRIPFEIVEIGAVKLDESGNIIDKFHSFVKPLVYHELHHIIKELTNFTMSELKTGRSFTRVVTDFIDWCGDDYIFCTWGALDITELQRNMDYYRIKLPVAPIFYYDLQKLFNIHYENADKTTRSLEYAVDYLNIEVSSDFHRALDDAYYTALVFQKLDMSIVGKYYSIDYYQNPKERKDEIYSIFDTYSKFVSMEFESKTHAMDDKVVTSMVCYKCGKKLRKKIRWFSDNSKIYYALASCPEHGYVKGKIRMKKSTTNNYFVVKTLKLTDEAGSVAIKNRQLEIRKKRKLRKKTT